MPRLQRADVGDDLIHRIACCGNVMAAICGYGDTRMSDGDKQPFW